MSLWIILSWVFVAIMTVVNVIVFLKLKGAGEQMMQMIAPGAKDMGEAVAQMQKMMGGMGAMRGGRPGFPGGMGGGSGAGDAQLKAAMQMLQQKQRKR
jgi:hypothetical protein